MAKNYLLWVNGLDDLDMGLGKSITWHADEINLARDRLIILSDMHKGARTPADYFQAAEWAYRGALESYYKDGYTLITLGDAEDLWAASPEKVLESYADTLALEARFHHAGRYHRLWGEFDRYWVDDPSARSLITNVFKPPVEGSGEQAGGIPELEIHEGLAFRMMDGEEELGTLLLLHGQQGTWVDNKRVIRFVRSIIRPYLPFLRLWRSEMPKELPLLLGESGERGVYLTGWAEEQENLVLISGHSHYPVFGYALGAARPHYFNPGACCYQDGSISGLEIDRGQIRLVHWRHLGGEAQREVLEYAPLRAVFKHDGLLGRASFLSDRPAFQDSLNYGVYMHALRDLIISPGTRTPLTLGIYGPWGSGKTTLMRMLERDLRRAKMRSVWFNAWLYDEEEALWSAFLQALWNKLDDGLGFWQMLLFKIRLLFRQAGRDRFPATILVYLLRMLLVILPLSLINPAEDIIQPGVARLVQAASVAASAALALWLVILPLWVTIRGKVTIDFSHFRRESAYPDRIAFLGNFRRHFQNVVESLPATGDRRLGDKRLVVFIDDLDRCSHDHIIQVLDALKLFVDIPGCVYVVGVDESVVQAALEARYGGNREAQRAYLAKIIQLPFRLPPLTPNRIKTYLHEQQMAMPDGRCLDVLVSGLVANPRKLKSTANSFLFLWSLVGKRPELHGRIRPVRLAKVVVLQHNYPAIYREIQDDPLQLAGLESYLRKRRAGDSEDRGMSHGDVLTLDRPSGHQSLRQQIVRSFKFHELDTLCADLDITRDTLPAQEINSLAREVILLMERTGRTAELIDYLEKQRPGRSWGDYKVDRLPALWRMAALLDDKDAVAEGERRAIEKMLLLFKKQEDRESGDDGLNFEGIEAGDIEVYFTLTGEFENMAR